VGRTQSVCPASSDGPRGSLNYCEQEWGAAMSTKLVRVLLVGEGAKGFSSLLQRLAKRGCECHMATSCSEATRLFASHAFDLVLCADRMEGINALIASLIGSLTTLFRCYLVEDSCWWLPAVRHGEKCLGAPALRPGEFAYALDVIVEEIKSGKHPGGKVADCGDEPEQRYTRGALPRKP
jgi:hypothetical protein